jgi:hypothetical protein
VEKLSFLAFSKGKAASNVEEYEPSTYALDAFSGDQGAAFVLAIVGRCIWQWGNLEFR